jgi:hypothetical protein
MLEIIVPALWTLLAIYIVWYCTSAKHYAPITSTEAKMLWVLHKNDVRCNAKRWREVRRIGKIVGFECECGCKHIQKRPLVSSAPALRIDSENSMLAKLGSSEKTSFERD